MAQLQNWIRQAREHWKEFQATRYRELEGAGTLETALRDAAERTFSEMVELEERGHSYYEAWEMVRENYLFPPDEAHTRAQAPVWAGGFWDAEPSPYAPLEEWQTYVRMVEAMDFAPGAIPSKSGLLRSARETIRYKQTFAPKSARSHDSASAVPT